MSMPAPVERSASAIRDLFGSDARLLAFARLAAGVLVPLTLVLVFLVLGTGPDGRRNWTGDILGSDFTQVWVAGRTALSGHAADVYDVPVHLRNLVEAFGPECRFAWHYPPVFLLPAALVALLPPAAAFPLWSLLSLTLFAAALRLAAGRRDVVLIALAHPLVFCNLGYGQNGLITAALLTFGGLLVDRRPLVAGLYFGLIAYKPQLAALAPLLLLATGRWRCLVACCATLLGLVFVSLAAFGVTPWIAFLGSLAQTNRIILQDAMSGLDLNMSAFGAVRLAGGGMAEAWSAQVVVSVAAVALAWRAWKIAPDAAWRAAILLAAAPMMTPYLPVYDLAPVVPATVLLVLRARAEGGLGVHERWLVVLSPLAAVLRPASAATGLSFGFLLGVATLACVLARSGSWARSPAPAPSAA